MISICLTTYNGGFYIKTQLSSILDQISTGDEVLIADDGSTDDTVAQVNSIKDPRVRFVAIGGNLGVVKNFERVLTHARGDYIFLCDQDDIWLPGKVARCVEMLQSYLLVVTDCKVVDKDLNEISPSFFAYRHSGPGILKNIYVNTFLGCCMAFQRSLLAYALPLPKDIPMHDMWLGLQASMHGNVRFIPECLSLYRRHDKNVSATSAKSENSYWVMIKYRAILIWHLCLRAVVFLFKKRYS